MNEVIKAHPYLLTELSSDEEGRNYKLKPNHGYTLKIKSKSAVGAYKVYKVIYKNTDDNHSN